MVAMSKPFFRTGGTRDDTLLSTWFSIDMEGRIGKEGRSALSKPLSRIGGVDDDA
jgi:hypothetical protein